MKNILNKICSLCCALFFLITASACASVEQLPEKLPAPEVSVDADGVASWKEVDGAIYYIYTLGNGAETPTAERSVRLTNGQSLKVKAVSGSDTYADSDFSAPYTYFGDAYAELSFYAVNDLHGKFIDTQNQPGVDEFTTYLKSLYADGAREEILLSSGDMWQGTVESSSNRGRLMTEWMNEVGFVSMTLGNHEYDWGAGALLPNSELAEFPFLAINVAFNGEAVDYCRASTVVERGGVKVGIIGAIGDCLSSISGEFSEGLSFATGNRLTALVKAESERLRREENCDFIVYSIHDGGSDFSAAGVNQVANGDMPYYDTALSDGYVDLVFEAHTHSRYILRDEYGVYHLQGGGENAAVSCAEVSFNTATGDYTVVPKLIGSGEYAKSSIEDDPVVGELYRKYFPQEDPYQTVLGKSDSRRDSGAICNLLAELYYKKGVEKWGGEYKIALGGGYLKTRSPYDIKSGNITYADLFSVLPFDNDIVLGKIKGADLIDKFLNSKNKNYHIYTTVNSTEVVAEGDYYIIVDSYTSSYRSNRITEIERLGGVYARDLLAAFVSGGGWSYA